MKTGGGTFSALIRDSVCLWNKGGWRFESIDGHLHVERDEHAHEELKYPGIDGTFLMGSHDPRDFTCRGCGELSPPPWRRQSACSRRQTHILMKCFRSGSYPLGKSWHSYQKTLVANGLKN